MKTENQFKTGKTRFCISVLIILSAVLGVLLFSETTSPIFHAYGKDSAMFQTIGMAWEKGLLPYRDLFDSKGPLIFFINMIGYSLTGNKFGVMLIQICLMLFTEFFIYKYISRRIGGLSAIFYTLLYPVGVAVLWQGGNLTEEYILPLLIFSFFKVNDWLEKIDEGHLEHKPLNAFFYGLTFGVAILTRITNALGICICVVIISLVLIYHREWKNLLLNAGSFISGTLMLVVPFVIYFALNNLLKDFLYGTLLYNIGYAANSMASGSSGLMDILEKLIMIIFGLYMIFGCVFLLICEKKKIKALFWIIPAVIQTVFTFSLRGFPHYGLIMVPYFYMLLLISQNSCLQFRRIRRAAEICFLILGIGIAIYTGNYFLTPCDEVMAADLLKESDYYSDIKNGKMLAYNVSGGFYLESDTLPCYKYCFMQDWAASQNENYLEDLKTHFQEAGVEWIVLYNDGSHIQIDDVLQKEYEEYETYLDGEYILFHRIGG